MPSIPSSPLTQALRSLYGTASTLQDFMDAHIAALKASGDQTISATGELLAAAKTGFMLGYAVPVAVVAVGQLLLGSPLTAVVSTASMMVSPVATSCAAVGAIWLGWRALKPVEQARILEAVKTRSGKDGAGSEHHGGDVRDRLRHQAIASAVQQAAGGRTPGDDPHGGG
jgi:uncharacterized membrane protein YfbV (UPF0208 family)